MFTPGAPTDNDSFSDEGISAEELAANRKRALKKKLKNLKNRRRKKIKKAKKKANMCGVCAKELCEI